MLICHKTKKKTNKPNQILKSIVVKIFLVLNSKKKKHCGYLNSTDNNIDNAFKKIQK